jgi:hypothetical protein
MVTVRGWMLSGVSSGSVHTDARTWSAAYPPYMGFSEPVRRSTLADANEVRDWRIYAELAQRFIAQARKLYAKPNFHS